MEAQILGPDDIPDKFGVNEPERIRRVLIAGLRERGRPLDLATALEIERTLGGK